MRTTADIFTWRLPRSYFIQSSHTSERSCNRGESVREKNVQMNVLSHRKYWTFCFVRDSSVGSLKTFRRHGTTIHLQITCRPSRRIKVCRDVKIENHFHFCIFPFIIYKVRLFKPSPTSTQSSELELGSASLISPTNRTMRSH